MRFLSVIILIVCISAAVMAQQEEGVPAQNFSVISIENEAFELEQLKGKIVLMTFWSTRCQICAAEIPDLNDLVSRFEGRNVVFLGLAWQDKAKLDAFLKEKPFDFKIVPQAFAVLLKYADRDSSGRLNMGFPSHFIVDQNGLVALKTNGFDKSNHLSSTIERLLDRDKGSVARKR